MKKTIAKAKKIAMSKASTVESLGVAVELFESHPGYLSEDEIDDLKSAITGAVENTSWIGIQGPSSVLVRISVRDATK